MFVEIDRHGFGERVQITKPLKVPNQVKHITVKPIQHEDNEEVKRIKEKWKEMKGSRTKSVGNIY
ncbi:MULTISPECIES: hypothetical protein [Bacillus cereus group]|uniref:Uncharacterized protein n=1 Tax=Bacillus mycoides TaxID=1405 RepID=A0ABX6Z905_BACMY|nr:hypothetical protein [Bacillus mycoides]AJH22214.1 hypothetical protein BG05_5405 [Bacillus mycoides]EEL96115.1 hypothetical protein bmyco0001_54760 [Bacillus mycoides DSM 2048]MDR4240294.1 hypothetical protein [Bacillus mycoides]MED1426493.1 hypothetical protein [Bacillus mycoides]MED1487538.1 hypothetical protein [Bacillus mycoides]